MIKRNESGGGDSSFNFGSNVQKSAGSRTPKKGTKTKGGKKKSKRF